jgi:hypothetical protein
MSADGGGGMNISDLSLEQLGQIKQQHENVSS